MRSLSRSGGAAVAGAAAIAAGLFLPSAALAQNYGARAAQARSQATSWSQQPRPTAVPAVLPAAPQMNSRPASTAVQRAAIGQAAAPGVTGLYSTQPRPVAASAGIVGLRHALTAFYLDMGRMPTAAEGLGALLRAPSGARNWRGPYVTVTSGRAPFADPWGNSYRLIDTSRSGVISFIIRSDGPDRLPNTADDLSISG